MQAERINFLKEQIQAEPDEAFNYYALSLEYLEKEPQKSLELFENLLIKFPDYLPTYYHAANLYFNLNILEKAKETYEKGIILAQNLKKEKTEKELKSAYQMFLDEIDE
ncbi:tetratricopeptide repeat protein [Lacihabitans sp. LS3-19]|nr:tetratricopeptide repeat protein [Lacihabitans sp. LS3-19]